jgi:hypothetical protein
VLVLDGRRHTAEHLPLVVLVFARQPCQTFACSHVCCCIYLLVCLFLCLNDCLPHSNCRAAWRLPPSCWLPAGQQACPSCTPWKHTSQTFQTCTQRKPAGETCQRACALEQQARWGAF